MHEHLFISYPGSEFDPLQVYDRAALVAEAVRRLSALRERGVSTFVDPCPIELGRDVSVMAEVSERSGVAIVCTTGFYHEERGLPFYWRSAPAEEIAALYIREIETGVGTTGIRAGAIKCATSSQAIGPVEEKFMVAACIAHNATGVPIITHTDKGLGGPEQQHLFAQHRVAAHHCLIGHCCGSPHHAYHRQIVEAGSYIGFDRIGAALFQSDEVRADNLVRLIKGGFHEHVMISHDRSCGVRGFRMPGGFAGEWVRGLMAAGDWPPDFSYIFTHFIPMLVQRGIDPQIIDRILIDNPRRFFDGVQAPMRAT